MPPGMPGPPGHPPPAGPVHQRLGPMPNRGMLNKYYNMMCTFTLLAEQERDLYVRNSDSR